MMRVDDELDETWVFADQCAAAGDPRAELLALELAAEHASTSEEARRLNREAQRIRDAHEALAWPLPLRETHVESRAGFVVRGSLDQLANDGVDPALWLSARRLDFHAARAEDHAPTLARAWRAGLRLDELQFAGRATSGPPTELGPLIRAALEAPREPLCDLYVGGEARGIEGLARLEDLRRLGVHSHLSPEQLTALEPLALEHLLIRSDEIDPRIPTLFGDTLQSVTLYALDLLYGPLSPPVLLTSLPRLRRLVVGSPCPGLATPLAQLDRLEVLKIKTLTDPGVIEALSRLHLGELHVDQDLSAASFSALAEVSVAVPPPPRRPLAAEQWAGAEHAPRHPGRPTGPRRIPQGKWRSDLGAPVRAGRGAA
jgi:hypothetical protein